MSLEIDGYQQWTLLIKAILCGGCLGIFYDFFRFLRVIKKFGKYSVAVQDIIFWCVSALVIFVFMMVYSCGVVRIYLVLGFAFGGIMYYFSFGKLTFALFKLIKKAMKIIGGVMRKYLLVPIGKLLNKYIVSPMKKLNSHVFNMFKVFLKNFFRQKQKTTCK